MFVRYVRKITLILAFLVHYFAWNAGVDEDSGIKHNLTSAFPINAYTS